VCLIIYQVILSVQKTSKSCNDTSHSHSGRDKNCRPQVGDTCYSTKRGGIQSDDSVPQCQPHRSTLHNERSADDSLTGCRKKSACEWHRKHQEREHSSDASNCKQSSSFSYDASRYRRQPVDRVAQHCHDHDCTVRLQHCERDYSHRLDDSRHCDKHRHQHHHSADLSRRHCQHHRNSSPNSSSTRHQQHYSRH